MTTSGVSARKQLHAGRQLAGVTATGDKERRPGAVTGRENRVAGEQNLRSVAERHEIAAAAVRMARCGNHFHAVGVHMPATFHRHIDVRVLLDGFQLSGGRV